MAELLAGTGLDPEQDSYVAAIRSAGTALAALVDGLLDLARIDAGRPEDDASDASSPTSLSPGSPSRRVPEEPDSSSGVGSLEGGRSRKFRQDS